MPNRIIRDFSDDSRIDKLTKGAEILYRRLWNKADDYGRYYADAQILRAKLFPLKGDKVNVSMVEMWLGECCACSLINCYTGIDLQDKQEKTFLEIQDFNQTVRIKRSLFPVPNKIVHSTCEADAPQMISLPPPEEEKEEEKENEKKLNKKEIAGYSQEVWKLYPRHDGEAAGLKAIEGALAEGIDVEYLKKRVSAYAITVEGRDQKYIKLCENWFKAKRYNDPSLDFPRRPNDPPPVDLDSFRLAFDWLYNVSSADYPDEDDVAIMNASLAELTCTYKPAYEDICSRLADPKSAISKFVRRNK